MGEQHELQHTMFKRAWQKHEKRSLFSSLSIERVHFTLSVLLTSDTKNRRPFLCAPQVGNRVDLSLHRRSLLQVYDSRNRVHAVEQQQLNKSDTSA